MHGAEGINSRRFTQSPHRRDTWLEPAPVGRLDAVDVEGRVDHDSDTLPPQQAPLEGFLASLDLSRPLLPPTDTNPLLSKFVPGAGPGTSHAFHGFRLGKTSEPRRRVRPAIPAVRW